MFRRLPLTPPCSPGVPLRPRRRASERELRRATASRGRVGRPERPIVHPAAGRPPHGVGPRATHRRGREVEVQVVELRDLAADIANNLVTGFPSASLAEAIEAVTSADGLIAVTPVFSASYSGLFKSFFDVIDNDALTGKAVLTAATGGTARHSLALEHALRPLFACLRAVVVPTAVYAASEDWGGSGDPLTDTLPRRIARAAR